MLYTRNCILVLLLLLLFGMDRAYIVDTCIFLSQGARVDTHTETSHWPHEPHNNDVQPRQIPHIPFQDYIFVPGVYQLLLPQLYIPSNRLQSSIITRFGALAQW